mmetsp:Transcript_1312/g.1676  ORF Transcript_1312/g.1676 Transcript_1312/m.1676 type:complete len:241 (+) Transcript_1312:1710-2432(+)
MNPLNSIIGFSQYLYSAFSELISEEKLAALEDLKPSGEECFSDDEDEDGEDISPSVFSEKRVVRYLKVLQIILSSSSMMQLLNSAILNITLIRQSKFNPRFERVFDPLKPLVELVKLFKANIEQKNLNVIISESVQGDLWAIEKLRDYGIALDVSIFKQILYNIILNACKFSRDSGSILISLSALKEHASGQSVTLLVEIEDNGVGMSQNQVSNLFKLFEKIKNHFSFAKEKGQINFTNG